MNVIEQPARLEAAGSPVLPALLLGGAVHSVTHPLQLARLLGAEPGPLRDDAERIARDLQRVLEAWLDALAVARWQAVLAETPSRGRSTLELAVNTFVPVGLLPRALETGRFVWPGDPRTGEAGDGPLRAYELSIEAAIAGPTDLASFAGEILEAWTAFARTPPRGDPFREVETPNGSVPYVALLEAQLLHAAQHYRQATTFLRTCGEPVPAFDLDGVAGLRLPRQVY